METEDHAETGMLNTLWSLLFQSADNFLDQLNLTNRSLKNLNIRYLKWTKLFVWQLFFFFGLKSTSANVTDKSVPRLFRSTRAYVKKEV